MEFVRYGSLVPQFHEINKSEISLHTAPVEYGFYAFPRGYEEPFLLGGVGNGNLKNGRYKLIRDSRGHKIKAKLNELYDYHGEDCTNELKEPYRSIVAEQKIDFSKVIPYREDSDGIRSYGYIDPESVVSLCIENEPRRFKYNRNIWHHLDTYGSHQIVKPCDIIKHSAEDYWALTDIKTYKKALIKYVKMMKFDCLAGDHYLRSSGAIASGIPNRFFSNDYFEVYIEKIS